MHVLNPSPFKPSWITIHLLYHQHQHLYPAVVYHPANTSNKQPLLLSNDVHYCSFSFSYELLYRTDLIEQRSDGIIPTI